MTSLGTIDASSDPQFNALSNIYIEPKCCAFMTRSPENGSTDVIIDRFLYNKDTEHFDNTSPVSIKAVTAKKETLINPPLHSFI